MATHETLMAFEHPETLIREFNHWVLLLRSDQVTVGSLVAIIKEDIRHLGDVDAESWAEFAKVSKFAEHILKDSFNAEKFNYLALMMKDPQVHFHIIPRYSQAVTVEGDSFTDSDWPQKTELNKIEMKPEIFQAILNKLRQF